MKRPCRTSIQIPSWSRLGGRGGRQRRTEARLRGVSRLRTELLESCSQFLRGHLRKLRRRVVPVVLVAHVLTGLTFLHRGVPGRGHVLSAVSSKARACIGSSL